MSEPARDEDEETMSTAVRVGGLPARFTKMAGAGNDFLVFEGRLDVGAREEETIRAVCRRGTGVGADGVLFVADGGAPGRVVLEYRNADGSRSFCMNGTRCAARYASERLGLGADLVVETENGPIPAEVRGGRVTLSLPDPVALGARVPTLDGDAGVLAPEGIAVEIGVPHLVVDTADGVDVESLDVARLGPPLRRHPNLPAGANVTFITRRGPSRLAARSFERGVEAETLACGGGVVAAAVVAVLTRGEAPPIDVATRSGAVLTVGLTRDGSVARAVTLTGDARFVYEGTLGEEVL